MLRPALLFGGLLLLHVARAQITGAVCEGLYGPELQVNDTDGHMPSGTKLCMPKFCPAPDEVEKANLGKHVYNNAFVYNTYTFDAGSYSFQFTPQFSGYEFEKICLSDVTLTATNGNTHPPAAPPPAYRAGAKAKYWKEGACAPISPLPTLSGYLDIVLLGVWVVVIILLFFALALVCEEFLVPAINIVCEKTGIPDDVAGATLLAAGCNSPEFFASIIGIFIADSTVGVGTVVGSAPFNVCCITGGASLAVGGMLYLDPWLMGRELIGLFIALMLFLTFMDDYRILWWEALIMLVYYALYVLVLGKFDKIKFFLLWALDGSRHKAPNDGPPGSERAIEDGDTLMLEDMGGVPLPRAINDVTGMSTRSARLTFSGNPAASQSGSGAVRGSLSASVKMKIASSLERSIMSTQLISFEVPKTEETKFVPFDAVELQVMDDSGKAVRSASDAARTNGAGPSVPRAKTAPSLPPDASTKDSAHTKWARLVEECQRRVDAYPNGHKGYSGALMKRPQGFTKVQVRRVFWEMRWFALDNHATHPLRYSRFKSDGSPNSEKFVAIPLQEVTAIARVSLDEIHLVTPDRTWRMRIAGDYDSEVMQRWFDHIVVKLETLRKFSPPPVALSGQVDEHADSHGPWWAMPEGGAFGKFFHCITFSIKALVFLTTPNVLKTGNEKFFALTIVISMVWLAVFAVLMTNVIEYVGCGIGVSGTVMGLSLGAIGTSFPNLYASILVAKQGQGGMSICQAIASNTFNVCICLGLLWLLKSGLALCDYGSHGTDHRAACHGCYPPSGLAPMCPYLLGSNNKAGSTAGSTKGAVVIVFIWYVFFIFSLVISKLYIRKWSAYVMFALYFAYIVWEFAAAFAPSISDSLCISKLNICI